MAGTNIATATGMEYRTRKVVKPADLNPLNALFGGRLLAWVDEECLIYCGCQLQHTRLVTKYISEINFVSPAHQSDVIEIGVETVTVGRTSITVRCEARNRDTQQLILSIDNIVFVALNSKGKPTMHKLARMEHETRRPNWARPGLLDRVRRRPTDAADEQNQW